MVCRSGEAWVSRRGGQTGSRQGGVWGGGGVGGASIRQGRRVTAWVGRRGGKGSRQGGVWGGGWGASIRQTRDGMGWQERRQGKQARRGGGSRPATQRRLAWVRDRLTHRARLAVGPARQLLRLLGIGRGRDEDEHVRAEREGGEAWRGMRRLPHKVGPCPADPGDPSPLNLARRAPARTPPPPQAAAVTRGGEDAGCGRAVCEESSLPSTFAVGRPVPVRRLCRPAAAVAAAVAVAVAVDAVLTTVAAVMAAVAIGTAT